jgi:hypothetical protein
VEGGSSLRRFGLETRKKNGMKCNKIAGKRDDSLEMNSTLVPSFHSTFFIFLPCYFSDKGSVGGGAFSHHLLHYSDESPCEQQREVRMCSLVSGSRYCTLYM